MTVSRRMVKGKKLWVIDRRFRTPRGEERYRRAAQVQTRAAAHAEERRIEAHFAEHGTVAALMGSALPAEPIQNPTWQDAASPYYQKHALPALEASTRRGYRLLLAGPHMAHWNVTV